MKKSYSFALLSGLFLLGSCAADAPENVDGVNDDAEVGYLRIEFSNPGYTRAFDEDNATDAECEIDNADFVFYCADGSSFSRKITSTPSSTGKWVETDASHSGDKCAVVKLPKMPIAVACVINGEKASYEGDLNADELYVTKYAKDVAGNKKFYMSSSKYYDENNNYAISYRTPITPNMLCTTEAEAADAKTQAVKINVERYVAKINIRNITNDTNFKLDGEGKLNPESEKDFINGNIKFEPIYTFLTATEDHAFTIKKLPEYSSLDTPLQGWDELNDMNKRRSGWVRRTSGDVNYQTLTGLQKGGKTFGTNPVYYAYENRPEKDVQQTSVVVAGKYTVTDNNGKSLAADDGTFYLVAFNDKFDVYKTEKDAVNAMGGNYDGGDRLVQEGVMADDDKNLPAFSDKKWQNWTGWMQIKGKPSLVTRCVKYNGGYGYYARQIQRAYIQGNSYNAIVRNHVYNVSIRSIAGMGVGIPDKDQPIIPIPGPDPKDQNYYLHMSVTVNPWVMVKQDVEWK